ETVNPDHVPPRRSSDLKGFEAIAVAEHDEPEAIYGSDLQRIAYPDDFRKFVGRGRELQAAAEHSGKVLDIQARGEYAYAATGPRSEEHTSELQSHLNLV